MSSASPIPASGSLLASLDPSSRRALVRARNGQCLREKLHELVETNGEAAAPLPSPSKRRRTSVDAASLQIVDAIDPAHGLDVVVTGDDPVVEPHVLKALLAASRRPPFIDAIGLASRQADALAMAAWEDDVAPKQQKPRIGWEDEAVHAFFERVKYGKRALAR
jgi:hypothetical protein